MKENGWTDQELELISSQNIAKVNQLRNAYAVPPRRILKERNAPSSNEHSTPFVEYSPPFVEHPLPSVEHSPRFVDSSTVLPRAEAPMKLRQIIIKDKPEVSIEEEHQNLIPEEEYPDTIHEVLVKDEDPDGTHEEEFKDELPVEEYFV